MHSSYPFLFDLLRTPLLEDASAYWMRRSGPGISGVIALTISPSASSGVSSCAASSSRATCSRLTCGRRHPQRCQHGWRGRQQHAVSGKATRRSHRLGQDASHAEFCAGFPRALVRRDEGCHADDAHISVGLLRKRYDGSGGRVAVHELRSRRAKQGRQQRGQARKKVTKKGTAALPGWS